MKLKHASCGLVLFGLSLSGCAAIPGFGPPPVDAYDLRAPVSAVQEGKRLARTQILVPEPTAQQILDGQDIAIRTSDGALQLLGGARWSDRLPRLVQNGLIETYERTGRLGGVGRPGEGLAIDYQIIVDIRSFEIRVGSGYAYVELFARVLNDRSGEIRVSRDFVATVPVAGSGDEAFVAALDNAFKGAAAEIVAWSIEAM